MRHLFTVFKWEISKILTNWQKTAAIFLIPAAIMVFAINIFPQLVKYLSTGSFGGQKVIVVNCPDSFRDYNNKVETSFDYEYETWTVDELNRDEDYFYSRVDRGELLVIFGSYDGKSAGTDFDGAVTEFYKHIAAGDVEYKSEAFLAVFYAGGEYANSLNATSFEENVSSKFVSSLPDILGGEYGDLIASSYNVDDYNPITYVMNHRANANYMAARVVPGILTLLMYYCVFSLSGDMIAQEKNRGFLAKLKMTPVSPGFILGGKTLAIVGLVTVSGMVSFVFLFMSSWLNHSNDSMSLLPFGMLLTPSQLFCLIIAMPLSAAVMAVYCAHVCLCLTKYQDIIANMQIPLLLLLVDFFLQLGNSGRPMALEYLLPVHNTTALYRTIFLSTFKWKHFAQVIICNLLVVWLGFRRCTSIFSEESKR